MRRSGCQERLKVAAVLILVVASAAAGCAKQETQKVPPAAPTPLEETGQQKVKPQDDYAYTPVGKKDPFRPPSTPQSLTLPPSGPCEKRDLTCWDIDQLKLVGIVTGTDQPTASIEDPKGKGHAVVAGTEIGKNGGRITRITKEEVTVQEEYTDAQGRRVINKVPLRLPKEPVSVE
ncbi:MAG: pilus assembly protein PilP [Deltaproteobacteria bacterium]|nr:pilus assembly protein PilP [Deltaproteobacteria bacterium]